MESRTRPAASRSISSVKMGCRDLVDDRSSIVRPLPGLSTFGEVQKRLLAGPSYSLGF